MRFILPTLFLAAAVTAAPQVPDNPISFYAELFKESADCSGGATSAYLGSRGNCVNIPIGGEGSTISAVIKVGEVAKYYLAGWTEPDCQGTVVMVETSPGVCTDLSGLSVASWSNDESPFGK